jgi:hypothetical protein
MPEQNAPHFQVVTNGTNRYERELPALSPANVYIDGYEVIDRMFYALGMAKNYRYFNLSDKSNTKWDEVLIQNKYFRLAYIYKYDYSTKIDRYTTALVLAENIADVGKAKLETYLQDLITDVGTLNEELDKWAAWFNPNTDTQFKDFHSLILVTKAEITQISEIILAGILADFGHEHAADIVFEINDAVTKVKRYFNDITGSAKKEFEKQLSADQNIEPHISLFLAFLQLFDKQKDQLNSLTAKHLNYCYEQLLGLGKNEAVPDSVYVTFALAKGVSSYIAPVGTQLNAGKDENSLPIVFTTDGELVVDDITVADFKTLFINHFSSFTQIAANESKFSPGQLLAATDGKRLVVQDAMKMVVWDGAGGSSSSSDATGGATLPTGTKVAFTDEDLGLIISSSMFYIEDGQAETTLSLNFTEADKLYSENFNEIGPSPFSVYVTAASGWVKISSYKFTPEAKRMDLQWKMDATAAPIVSYNPAIHAGGYALQKPAVKLELLRTKGDGVSPYIYLQNLVIKSVRIHVQVTNNKKLMVQTTAGMVGPGSPFQAFGPVPQPGGYFKLRNANIFNKNLDAFSINMEWLGLPVKPGGFDTYYFKYNQPPFYAGLTDTAFKVDISTLNGNVFEPIGGKPKEYQLFATDNNAVLKSSSQVRVAGGSKLLGFNNAASLEIEKQLDFSMPGLIRLSLSSPDTGFGFDFFPSVLSYSVIQSNEAQTKGPNVLKMFGNKEAAAQGNAPHNLPNQPFIPVIKAVNIDYELSYSEDLDNTKENFDSDITLIHANPFGYKTIYPNIAEENFCYLAPRFMSGNNLFIGLNNLVGSAQVNLLFTLNENVIENDFVELTPVSWFYLRDNEWTGFDPEDIISDSTSNFTRNGIVKLNLPRDLSANDNNNTSMPPNLGWLLATVQDDNLDDPTIRNLSSMIYSITNNAVSATRLIDAASTSLAPLTLAAGTIAELVTRQSKIAVVSQPLPSFGGTQAERSGSFYIRVSERLRHKARPLSAWELERIVLEKFPEIRYVKCINLKASRWNMPNINPAPDILVTVVGDVFYDANGGPASSNNIRVSFPELSAIKDFLTSILNAKLNIAVSNPHLERLKFKCQIKFKNNDLSKERDLERDFANYLTPWLFNPDRRIKITSTIYKSDVLGFIRNLAYVEKVKDLVIVHLFEKSLAEIAGIGAAPISMIPQDERTEYFLEEVGDDRPVRTFLPYGVFAASAPHYLLPFDAKNEDRSKFAGIDIMTINDDFRIRDEIPAAPIEEVIDMKPPGKFNFTIDI